MENKNIVVITIVILWIISLMITGFLALLYNEKIRVYKNINVKYLESVNEQENNYQLKEQKIDYELPLGEICYFFKKGISLYKKTKEYNGKKDKQWSHDYKFYYKNNVLTKINADIYLTNKNVLIEYENKYLKIDIKKIFSLIAFTFYGNKEWVTGVEIIFDDNKVLLNPETNDLVLAYRAIKKGELTDD
ncbi:hypothetical protein SHELI_v1c05260 [Spiroplasma helicoides]|uniref:Uncharacterized protein n=1 Tax=Spiroplasma helicoides TaxID=216938 RepID=A0A1B3SKN0_9MOLU|nr:hypothetical protein [Spiroplasma helicoides]AOG60477.1 hypothetical protein SHELI_v1c05260 [Spiroplasma helicoides]